MQGALTENGEPRTENLFMIEELEREYGAVKDKVRDLREYL